MNKLDTLRAFLKTRQEKTWLVGGCVRDVLLARELHDIDIAVQGNAAHVARAFADAIGAAFYVMDETFDVARVILNDAPGAEINSLDANAFVWDFARMRGETLADDLRTRDFTVNAMAADAALWGGDAASVIDPLGALQDLAARQIRVVSPDVFRHDAVRLVRAARLEADLAFGIEAESEALMRRDALLIESAPMERVRDELMRILGAPNVLRNLRRLDELDLLGRILPEVNAMRGVTQSPPHIYNVFEHSLYAVAAAEEMERANYGTIADGAFADDLKAYFAQTMSGVRTWRELLRFTLLLHDIGKPATRTVEASGRIRYFGHEDKGAELVGPALRRLRLSNDESARVKTVIENHLRPILLAQQGPKVSKRAVYHFFRDTGDAGVATAVHAWCDQRATYGDAMPREIDEALQGVIGRLLDSYFHAHAQVVSPPPLLNGNDVMQLLGIAPGPRIRVALDAVREKQAEGEILTRAEAIAFLETMEKDGE